MAYQIGLYLFLLSKIVGDYKEAFPRLNNDWLMVSNLVICATFVDGQNIILLRNRLEEWKSQMQKYFKVIYI